MNFPKLLIFGAPRSNLEKLPHLPFRMVSKSNFGFLAHFGSIKGNAISLHRVTLLGLISLKFFLNVHNKFFSLQNT